MNQVAFTIEIESNWLIKLVVKLHYSLAVTADRLPQLIVGIELEKLSGNIGRK